MSEFTDVLMKQLQFIGEASNTYMSQKKQKLTGQQRVLEVLLNEDGMIQSYLGEVLDLRPSSLAELLKKMETSGDIIRIEDQMDKRIKKVSLTDVGREKAKKNASLKKEDYSESFFAGLSDDEKQIFSEHMKKIASGWSKDFKKQSEKFMDPMDRLRAMQEMRASFMKQYHGKFHDMSQEDQENLRKEMIKKMRNDPFGECMDHDGFRAHVSRCFGGGFHHGHGFSHGFWEEDSDK